MTVVVIDPETKSITAVPDFPLPETPMLNVPGLGLVLHQPLSPFDPKIKPFYFEPLGVLLGRVFVINPLQPVEPLVTWVNTLMVINNSTMIIPLRKENP